MQAKNRKSWEETKLKSEGNFWFYYFKREQSIEGKKKSVRENTKRIYGVEEKSVGKGKVEQMVVGTVSELGIFILFV